MINSAPISKYHCLFLLYPEEELPQIVGQDIMLLLLNAFKVFPGISAGYNSLGGASSINHLHFHLLFSNELTGGEKLPIENYPRKLWAKTSLINPQAEEN